MKHGHLQTHFHRHAALEKAHTDAGEGKTVEVACKPICSTIEGNVKYPLPNSAVRGVWASPDKTGPNLYTRRVVQLIRSHNAVYAFAPHAPVVQCYGLYAVAPEDPVGELFDGQTGECLDTQRLIDECCIALDEPKVGMINATYKKAYFSCYESEVDILGGLYGHVEQCHIDALQSRMGQKMLMGCVGYAFENTGQDQPDHCYRGYCNIFDLNGDGVIDEQDFERMRQNLGRKVRFNLYRHAYFGGDWFTTYVGISPHHEPGEPLIADYEYGGGYDAQSGVVHLLETPGPNRPVWVEYHHEVPAEHGENNIAVRLYQEEE